MTYLNRHEVVMHNVVEEGDVTIGIVFDWKCQSYFAISSNFNITLLWRGTGGGSSRE